MERIPRKPQRSIDGFIPSQQGRHVGFSQPAITPKPIQRVPVRRPGFYGQTSVGQSQQSMSGFTPRPANSRIAEESKPKIGDQPATRRPEVSSHFERPYKEPRKAKGKLSRVRNIRWKKVIKRTSLTFAVLLVLCGGWLGWKVIRNTSKVFGGSSDLLGFLSAQKLKGEDSGRVNILLAGNSADDPGHNGANLTDSIMVVSIDVKNNTAFMLSVPRDLYVNIPGNGHAKINEAYPDGQNENFSQSGYAKGGMGLLEETVSQDFGIPIDYYSLIDYSALKAAVNAVGGISINIQSEDPRGLYDPSIDWSTHGPLVKLSNGWHTITGEQALDLARARGDTYGSYGFAASDFQRTKDQRDMMLALKNKVMSSSVLANPIKLGQLFDAFGNNIHTDLSTGNIRRLYDISKLINSNAIKSVGLNDVSVGGQQDVNLLKSYATPTGQSALIPATGVDDYSQIQLYLKQLTSNNPLIKESASVVVLNGGNITGLAAKEKTVLTNNDIDVVSVADAPATAQTVIIDQSNGKMPKSKQALENLFGNNVTTSNKYGYPTADFIVVLGANQKDPTATSP
jgi:polyisoprenyl-teichoic acid--peptidoglycan teichoic acid transferase